MNGVADLSVRAEIEQSTKLSQRTKEKSDRYRARLVRAGEALEDDEWSALSAGAQGWVNAGVKALKKGSPVSPFPDLTTDGETTPEEAPKSKGAPVRETGGGIRVKEIMLERGMSIRSKDILAVLEEEGVKYSKSTLDMVRAEFRQTVRFLQRQKLIPEGKVRWEE